MSRRHCTPTNRHMCILFASYFFVRRRSRLFALGGSPEEALYSSQTRTLTSSSEQAATPSTTSLRNWVSGVRIPPGAPFPFSAETSQKSEAGVAKRGLIPRTRERNLVQKWCRTSPSEARLDAGRCRPGPATAVHRYFPDCERNILRRGVIPSAVMCVPAESRVQKKQRCESGNWVSHPRCNRHQRRQAASAVFFSRRTDDLLRE